MNIPSLSLLKPSVFTHYLTTNSTAKRFAIAVFTGVLGACGGGGNDVEFADTLFAECVAATGIENVEAIESLTCAGVPSTRRYVDASGIEQLTGLKKLTLDYADIRYVDLNALGNLITLKISNSKVPADMDLSHNSKLERLDLHDSDVRFVDLSENLNLYGVTLFNEEGLPVEIVLPKGDTMEVLNLLNTSLSELDLRDYPGLVEVYIKHSQLVNVELGSGPVLNSLYLIDAPLQQLDISDMSEAVFIHLDQLKSLSNLALPESTNLMQLTVHDTDLSCGKLERLFEQYYGSEVDFEIDSFASHGCGPDQFFPDATLAACVRVKNVPFSEIYSLTCENVKDATGLSKLTSLTTLNLIGDTPNNFSPEDVPKLETLQIDNLKDATLNFGALTNLRSVSIHGNLTGLKLDQNSKLESIFLQGDLDEVNVSQNSNLTDLFLRGNFGAVNVSGNPKLNRLQIESNQVLNGLDLSANANIQFIDIEGEVAETIVLPMDNQIKQYRGPIDHLNVNELAKLESLKILSSSASSLDLSNNTHLSALEIRNSDNLTSINLEHNLALQSIHLFNSKIQSLNLEDHFSLSTLTIDEAMLETLNLANTAINKLNLVGNEYLTSVNLSRTPITQIYSVNTPVLQQLNLEDADNLRRLELADSALRSLDLSNKPRLGYVSIGDAPHLEDLQLSGAEDLHTLTLLGNALTELDLSEFTQLKFLHLGVTKADDDDQTSGAALLLSMPNLKTLMTGQLQLLESVRLAGTALTSVDLSSLDNLERLAISNNPLSELILPESGHITELTLSSNDLISLDLSKQSGLEMLTITGTQVPVIDLSASAILGEVRFEDVTTELLLPSDNPITELQLKDSEFLNSVFVDFGFPSLNFLSIDNSVTGTPDLSSMVNLSSLYLLNMNIDAFDYSQRVNLNRLHLTEVEFEIIDLSLNSGLQHLFISNVACDSEKIMLPTGTTLTCLDAVAGD